MTTHSLKLVAERGGEIRFIRAHEQGLPCWFYMRMDALKLMEYEQRLKTGNMNVRDYGTILQSDWGDYPLPDMVAHMRETYGFETPYDESADSLP